MVLYTYGILSYEYNTINCFVSRKIKNWRILYTYHKGIAVAVIRATEKIPHYQIQGQT